MSPRRVSPEPGWQVLLPPGWVSIPTDPESSRKAIARLLDRMLAGKPRDELVELRIELDRRLRRQVDDAARVGATHVHALAEPVRGYPVSASLVTTPVRVGDPEQLAGALSAVLGTAEGVVEHGHADAGPHPALRRVRRRRLALELAPQVEQTVTSVDYVVPISSTAVLLLTFSTTTEPIVEELVALFDAVAQTLRST